MGVEGDEAVRVGSISCAEQFLHLKGCRRRNEKDDLRCLLVGVASVLDLNGRDVELLLLIPAGDFAVGNGQSGRH